MQLREVQRLFKYLDRQPPVHELVAAWMGLKDDGPKAQRPGITEDDLRRLAELDRKWGGARA